MDFLPLVMSCKTENQKLREGRLLIYLKLKYHPSLKSDSELPDPNADFAVCIKVQVEL